MNSTYQSNIYLKLAHDHLRKANEYIKMSCDSTDKMSYDSTNLYSSLSYSDHETDETTTNEITTNEKAPTEVIDRIAERKRRKKASKKARDRVLRKRKARAKRHEYLKKKFGNGFGYDTPQDTEDWARYYQYWYGDERTHEDVYNDEKNVWRKKRDKH